MGVFRAYVPDENEKAFIELARDCGGVVEREKTSPVTIPKKDKSRRTSGFKRCPTMTAEKRDEILSYMKAHPRTSTQGLKKKFGYAPNTFGRLRSGHYAKL